MVLNETANFTAKRKQLGKNSVWVLVNNKQHLHFCFFQQTCLLLVHNMAKLSKSRFMLTGKKNYLSQKTPVYVSGQISRKTTAGKMRLLFDNKQRKKWEESLSEVLCPLSFSEKLFIFPYCVNFIGLHVKKKAETLQRGVKNLKQLRRTC